MKTIGILGGLGPESTISYYSYITRKYYELRGDYGYPEILIHSFNFTDFIDAGYVLPDRVKGAIEGLAGAGADFVVAACNSVHVVYEEVAGQTSIPWVSIMDAAAEAIKAAGMKKVGLLGTIFTMRSDFFAKTFERQGINMILPTETDQQRINEIIFSELVRGIVKDESRAEVMAIVEAARGQGR